MTDLILNYTREYLTAYSGYCMTAIMAIYVFLSFLALLHKIPHKEVIFSTQRICIFLLQFFMFANLILASGKREYLLLYLFVQIFLGAIFLIPIIYEHCQMLLLNHMAMLIGIGFCMISRLSFSKAIRQYIIAVLSVLLALFIPFLLNRFAFWKKLGWLYALAGIASLGAVLILGEITHGSKISFTIQEITFQPSEFVKIIFIFFLASFLQEKVTFKKVVLTAILAGLHVIILVLSKDLGSALIFFVAFLFVLYIASRNLLYLLAGALGLSGASVVAYHLFSHIQVRVQAWKDPWAYIDAQGYQITQSLFAIGSGNWFGMGIFQGNPSAIPYVEADFIFSAVCEELGVLFGICMLFVCLSAFLSMMDIAIKQKNVFSRLIASGLGVIYIFQIFLTVGGGIKFIPLTGVTLPFISYGGSSVMTSVFLIFVFHALSEASIKGGKRLGRK